MKYIFLYCVYFLILLQFKEYYCEKLEKQLEDANPEEKSNLDNAQGIKFMPSKDGPSDTDTTSQNHIQNLLKQVQNRNSHKQNSLGGQNGHLTKDFKVLEEDFEDLQKHFHGIPKKKRKSKKHKCGKKHRKHRKHRKHKKHHYLDVNEVMKYLKMHEKEHEHEKHDQFAE